MASVAQKKVVKPDLRVIIIKYVCSLQGRVRKVYTLKMSGDYLSEFHYFSVLFLSLVFSLQSAARIYCVLPSFILTTHQGERLFYPLEFSFCFLIRKMKISCSCREFYPPSPRSEVSLFVLKVFPTQQCWVEDCLHSRDLLLFEL